MKKGIQFGVQAIIVAATIVGLIGCAGVMLPGHIYNQKTGEVLDFSIETSHGHGSMLASNPKTGEKFTGEYSGFYKGHGAVFGNIGGTGVALFQPPTGANAFGTLVGNHGTTIRVYFEIKPGLRPTGYGLGQDQDGRQYDFYF